MPKPWERGWEEEAPVQAVPAPDAYATAIPEEAIDLRPTGRLPRVPGENASPITQTEEQRYPVRPGMSLNDRMEGLGVRQGIPRNTILPWYYTGRPDQPFDRSKLEFRPSELLNDLTRGAVLPGHVAQGGSYTPEDATKMAMDWNPTPARMGRQTPKEFIASAPDSDQLAVRAGHFYDAMKKSGIHADEKKLAETIDKIQVNALREGVDDVLHPKAARVLKLLETEVGNQPNLSHLERMRRWIGNAADSADDDEARHAMKMMDELDNYIDKLSGLPATARALWHKTKKVEMLERAIKRAGRSASGVENGLRTEFRSILKNDRKMRGVTPREERAMEAVINGGSARTFFRNLRHAGFAGKGENRYLGPMVGAGIGSALDLPPEMIIGLTGAGTLAGKAARSGTETAADIAAAVTAQGRNPPPPALPKGTRNLPSRYGSTRMDTTEPVYTFRGKPVKRGMLGGFMENGEEVF